VLLEAPHLEELRVAAREELIEAQLALGEQIELIPELEALVAEHPFNERLRGQPSERSEHIRRREVVRPLEPARQAASPASRQACVKLKRDPMGPRSTGPTHHPGGGVVPPLRLDRDRSLTSVSRVGVTPGSGRFA
jgi:Bacterial transcriptional activator domain